MNFDTSISSRFLQSQNIEFIYTTFAVLNEEIFKVVKFPHPLNIELIFSVFDVLNDDKSRFAMLLQLLNMFPISSTFDVSILSNSIEFKFDLFPNITSQSELN